MNKIKNWEELQTIDPSQIVFLCGSGISLDFPTSLPTVRYFILETLNLLNTDKETILQIEQKMKTISYRFEVLISYIRNTCDPQLNVVKLFRRDTYNKIHDFMAYMYQHGSSIITTNFDTCIENALIAHGKTNYGNGYLIYQGDDLKEVYPDQHCFIKIHGSHIPEANNYDDLVITIENLSKTANTFAFLPNWKQTLLNLFKNKYIVVFGYSCSDDFDVVPLLHIACAKQIIWFDYDTAYQYPIHLSHSDNTNIEKLANDCSLSYFKGQIISMLEKWISSYSIHLNQGPNYPGYTLKDYIYETCPDYISKMLLKNTILLNYEMYNDIYFDNTDNRLLLQAIKAAFRLNQFDKTISLCQELKKRNADMHLKKEALYFESSAYYHLKEYKKALAISKQHVLSINKKTEPHTYLNAFINYTSIYYVYIWYNNDYQKLQDIRKNYLHIIQHAKGINIEAQANAYWGLGDLYKILEQNKKAMKYFLKARKILIQIGNTYALKTLDTIIDSLK